MPVEKFGRQLDCWKEGGRKACKSNITFNGMEADMHNLVPSIDEVNGDRSNYKFAADKVKVGQYGKCEFQVDFKSKRVFVCDDIKGDIARIYFYMSDKCNVTLSKQARKMMEVGIKLIQLMNGKESRIKEFLEYKGI
jgi:deoxyribonuclease I